MLSSPEKRLCMHKSVIDTVIYVLNDVVGKLLLAASTELNNKRMEYSTNWQRCYIWTTQLSLDIW